MVREDEGHAGDELVLDKCEHVATVCLAEAEVARGGHVDR